MRGVCCVGFPNSILCRQGEQKGAKTYNTWASLVVTDPTTDQAVTGLSMGERTGSRIPQYLWSYVLGGLLDFVKVVAKHHGMRVVVLTIFGVDQLEGVTWVQRFFLGTHRCKQKSFLLNQISVLEAWLLGSDGMMPSGSIVLNCARGPFS